MAKKATGKKKVAKRSASKKAVAKASKKPTRKKVAAKKTKSKAKSASVKKAAKPAKAKANKSAKAPPASDMDPVQFPEHNRKLPKTRLGVKELREFKKLLLEKRAELAGDVDHLTNQVSGRGSDESNSQSAAPIHMADIGSDNWEQEFTLGLIDNERTLLREIDEALARIDDRTYGICLATHKPIGRARLLAKPWAKYCIDYARAREEGRAI